MKEDILHTVIYINKSKALQRPSCYKREINLLHKSILYVSFRGQSKPV